MTMLQHLKNVSRSWVYVMSKIILVYHSIGNDDLFLQVPMEHFIKQIEFVMKRYKPQKVLSFFMPRKGSKNEVVIMFDDAFREALPAMDYLEEREIPFTIAVVEAFLQKNEYCSIDDIKKYRNAEFVFHTRTHRSLENLTESEIEIEITPSVLVKKLKMEKNILVYPQGIYDEKVFRVLKKKKYSWGLSCLPFHLSKDYKKKQYEVPRININGYLPYWKFKFFLTILGNLYLHLAYLKRKILGENYLDK